MSGKAETRTKATAFISYAREDKELVLALVKALEERDVEAVGDWLLTPGQDYERKLREMSMLSHALIFVITPDSIRSQACRNELALAVESKKQILPVSHRDHGDDNLLDSALRAPQWIFLRDGNDFASGVAELVKGINTDFALMEMHGRLLLAAEDWKNNGRIRSYLLRKEGLREAEGWLARTSVQPEKLPQPTPLEVEFILAGQRARSRGTRIAIGLALAVAISLSVLSVMALVQRSRALQQKQIADDRFTRVSVASGSRLLQDGDLPGALLWFANPLSIEPKDEAVLRQRIAVTEGLYPRLLQLMPHDADISIVQLSAAGDRVLTVSENTVRGWDPRSGALLWSRPTGSKKTTAVALSHDGASYAIVSLKPQEGLSLSESSELRFVDGATGKVRAQEVLDLGEHPSIWAVPDDTFILSGSDDSTLLWRPGRNPALRKIDDSSFSFLSTGPSGRILMGMYFGGSWILLGPDGSVIAKGAHELSVHSEFLQAVALSPGGTRLATADSTGKIVLWDAKTSAPIGKPLHHGRAVHGMAFSPGGGWLASVGDLDAEKKAIIVWNAVSGEQKFKQELPKPGTGLAFSPSGRYLLSFSTAVGADAYVWDIRTRRAAAPVLANVFGAAWTPDGRTIVTAGSDRTVRTWDLFPPTLLSLEQQDLLRKGRFTSDNQTIVVPADKRLDAIPIDRFDRADGFAARQAQTEYKWVINAAGSIGVQERDRTLTAFDRNGRSFPQFGREDVAGGRSMKYVNAAEVSTDGRTVMIAGGVDNVDPFENRDNGQVWVWDVLTGRARAPALQHDDPVKAARFSPDGKRIVSAGFDGTARIWSAENGAPLHRLEHGGGVWVYDAVFDSKGERVATASASEVRIWNAATGELMGPVIRPDGSPRLVRFSPDDALLLTMEAKMEALHQAFVMRLWDVTTHEAKAAPTSVQAINFNDVPPRAAFSPDGRLIVVTEKDGFRVFDSSTMEAITPRLDNATGWPLMAGQDRRGEMLLLGIGTQPGSAHRVVPWALPSDPRPANEMMPELELIASRRLDATGALVNLTPAEIKSRWERLKANRPRTAGDGREELLAWHRREADECAAFYEWPCVLWHTDRLQAEAPAAMDVAAHMRKAHALMWMGRWPDAAAEYATARRLGAAPAETVPYIVRARAATGDPREHQELVAELIGLAKSSNDAYTRANWLRTALLAPLPVSDRDRQAVLELMEADQRSAVDESGRMSAHRVLALLEYRSGRFAEAFQHIQAIEKANYSDKGDFLPALVAWRMGKRDDAMKRYDEASRVPAAEIRIESTEQSVLQAEASNLIPRR